MKAVLILNSDCSISALTEVEQYLSFSYQEQGCVVMQVEVHQDYFNLINKKMWDEKQNVYVLPDNVAGAERLVPNGLLYFWCDIESDLPTLILPF